MERGACIHLGGAAAQGQRAPPQLHEPSGRALLGPAAAAVVPVAVVPVMAVVRRAVAVHVVTVVRRPIDGHAGGNPTRLALRLHKAE